MGIFSSIRQKQGLKELQKIRSRQRSLTFLNWEEVNKVGILYNAGNPEITALVCDFYRLLYAEGKLPFTLGYIDISDKSKLPSARLGFDYISRRDLNRKNIPLSVVANNFRDEVFDVLFDFNVEEQFPLYAVAVLSRARMKVGLDNPANDHLNLTIQLEATDAGKTIDQLIHHLKSYMSTICA